MAEDAFDKCFIMLCNKRTENECLQRNLFGDRKQRFEHLSDIEVGDAGFLLNTTTNELIGVFKAQSEVQLDIEEEAWQREFQAQVRVEPVGELKRVKEAAIALANAGVELASLPSGALLPVVPIQYGAVANKILSHFRCGGEA